MPSNHLVASVAPCSSYPQSFPASESFPMSWLFASGGKVLELQHQSFQWIFRVDFLKDWLLWSPYCPRDSQEFSTAPQFESIIFPVLSLLYGPTLTSIHDYWKSHSFDRQTFVGKVMSMLFIMLSRELSGVFSRTTVQKHQFFGVQPSSWSSSHICALLLDRP